jgi:hypothetical protein
MNEWIPVRNHLRIVITDSIQLPDELEVRLRFILQQCVASILSNAIIHSEYLQKGSEILKLERLETANSILQEYDSFASLKLIKEMNKVVISENDISENLLIQRISHKLLIDLIDLNKKTQPFYRWILETCRNLQEDPSGRPYQFSDLFNPEGTLVSETILGRNLFGQVLRAFHVLEGRFFKNYEIVTRIFILVEKAIRNNLISKDLVDLLYTTIDECAFSLGCKPDDLNRLAEQILSDLRPRPRLLH